MDDIQNFKNLLKKGLFFHNLENLEKICNNKVFANEKNLVAWYILEDIFHQVQDMWETYEPITVKEAEQIDSALVEPIDHLLNLMLSGEKEVKIIRQLEKIIKEYIELRKTFRK